MSWSRVRRAEYMRQARRAPDRCGTCNKRPPVAGMKTCEPCLERRRVAPAEPAVLVRAEPDSHEWREVRDWRGRVIGVTNFHGRSLPPPPRSS